MERTSIWTRHATDDGKGNEDPWARKHRAALVALTITVLLLLLAAPAQGIVVLWHSGNTTVTLGLPFDDLEFENPLSGAETVAGYSVLQWRDADYNAGPPRWYDDWSVSHPAGIDGNVNEIWMRQAGQRIWTATTTPSTVVSIHLNGDGNDGLADVKVDGQLVAQLDMGTVPGSDRACIVVTDLPDATHDVEVLDMGMGQYGDDLATLGAAALGAGPGTPLEAKWSQTPHPPGEGFDAVSDLWWSHEEPTGLKWLQLPDYIWPGLHAHAPIVMADDWLCEGGPVVDFDWWGNYELDDFGVEKRGAGIASFQLSIHGDAGGVPGPLLWSKVVLFAEAEERAIDARNSEFSQLYLYGYELDQPFDQQPGRVYWFDISAIPVNPQLPPIWRWQEAGRVPDIKLSPAVYSTGGPWIPTSSDMAFAVSSNYNFFRYVNRVMVDDFVSDGREVLALRWWGSYWDDLFLPGLPDTGHQVDGWLITFHWADANIDPTCPPDFLFDPPPTVLGTYYAPESAVEIIPTNGDDCLDHHVFEYFIKLGDCCLLCSEPDPRTGDAPAQFGGFIEQAGFRYWLSIQAVTGVLWTPPLCDKQFTGHLPSLRPGGDGHYWGWHTSPASAMPHPPLDEACVGAVVDFLPFPPGCWNYGEWEKELWRCEPIPPAARVDMAFELLAEPYALSGVESVVTVNTHGGVGSIGVPLDIAASVGINSGAVTTETRLSRITRLEITCIDPFDPSVAGLGAAAVTITPDPGVAIATSLTNADKTLVLDFSPAMPDEATYTIALTDAAIAAGPCVPGDRGFELRGLLGNVVSESGPGPQVVNAIDIGLSGIRGKFGAPVVDPATALFDVNQDGAINALDMSCVRLTCGVWGNTAP